MPTASNLRFHDSQFQATVATGTWRWTTRLDLSLSAPSYSIRDIISPFGILRDSIPIPGDVVQEMAASIVKLKENFAPHILVGPPTSLVIDVEEGQGFSAPDDLIVTNDGVFGSLLSATLTPSAEYLKVTPGLLSGLAANATGYAKVSVDATSLLAADSPYSESITIQDPTAANSPQTLPITINVRPKATIAVTPVLLTFSVVKPLDGNYPGIPTQTFVVSNTGPSGSVLEFDVKKLKGLSDWLTSFLPANGHLESGESETITVTVKPQANMLWGTYTEKLRVYGYSSNSYVDVEIRLVIT